MEYMEQLATIQKKNWPSLAVIGRRWPPLAVVGEKWQKKSHSPRQRQVAMLEDDKYEFQTLL